MKSLIEINPINAFRKLRLRKACAALEIKCREQRAEIARMRAAIEKTLDENGHLADGDNCTLIHLKTAIGYEEAEDGAI
jgi:hypothetical protein